MKRILILILAVCGVFFSIAQSSFIGDWEVYDTLSIEKTVIGTMTLNKIKLYHKKLIVNENGEFELIHIEPKGFFIDANIKGEWKSTSEGILLAYNEIFTDNNGKNTIREITELLKTKTANILIVKYEDKEMYYYKK